jgi:recombination DNA repair RAD52 pathway protein
MKTQEQVLQELDSKIPREEVSSRDAGQGRKLDYVSGYYVISQLNRILGPDNWAYSSEVNLLHSGMVNDRHSVHYSARVRFVAKFPNGETTEFTDYGYGDGMDKTNPGKAHELAIKESITDGIKRCAKNLGNRLGLALYSKDQENVEETPTAPKLKVTNAELTTTTREAPNREIINKKITAISKVVIAKKLKTLDELKTDIKTKYGVDQVAQLPHNSANELLSNLEKLASIQ